jgi:hypothetical protein
VLSVLEEKPAYKVCPRIFMFFIPWNGIQACLRRACSRNPTAGLVTYSANRGRITVFSGSKLENTNKKFNILVCQSTTLKVLPRTGHKGPEGEQKYSSTLSLTSALDESGWSTPRPGRFTPGKETRYPL